MQLRKLIAFAAALLSMTMIESAPATANKNPMVTIVTTQGPIRVELYPDRAPITVANFLRYVNAGAWANGDFMRTVTPGNQPRSPIRIDVIQAEENADFQKREFPPIRLERTNVTGIHHVDGTISMARDGPDSATASFFICIGNQPSLDFGGRRNPDGQGFGAFGRVISGMDVVRAIWRSPAEGQTLKPPIAILRIFSSEQS